MFEIGNTLREARLRRGLDVLECEAGTKIRAKYLRAMEEEQFDLMPSPTYVRGFLRAYAEFLDLDGQLVLDEYESRFDSYDAPDGFGRTARAARAERDSGPVEPRPASPPRRPGRPRRRRRTEVQLLWLAIGGVMAVALLVWTGVGNTDSPAPLAQVTAPATAPLPATVAAEPDTPAVERPQRTKPTVIVLTGVGDRGCWVQVKGKDAKGPTAYEGVIGPGEARTFKVREGIWMRAANPAGLAVTVSGKAAALESTATSNYLVSREGAELL